MTSGETPRASSSRVMTRSEAEMGKDIAVMRTKMEELRRDVVRIDGVGSENSAQILAAAEKASAAISLARQALEEARRHIDTAPINITGTGPHSLAPPNGRRDATVGGGAAIGGAALYALVEFLIRIGQ